MKQLFSGKWLLVWVTLAYALIAVCYTWPMAPQLGEALPWQPGESDVATYIWGVDFFRESITAGQSPLYSQTILHPLGGNLLMNTSMPLMGLFSLLFENLWLAMGLFLLLNFVVAGLGGYLLARRFLTSPFAAFVVGFVFAFSPQMLGRLGIHYNIVLISAIPYAILAFLHAFAFRERRFLPQLVSWKHFTWLVLSCILMVLMDYYATFMFLYFCLFYAMYFWLVPRFMALRARVKWMVVGLVVLGGHGLVLLLRDLKFNNQGAFWWSGDLLGFLAPTYNNWLYNGAAWKPFRDLYSQSPESMEYQIFMGYGLLLLGLWTLVYAIRKGLSPQLRPLAFVAVIFVALLFPQIQVAGHRILHPITAALHYIPFFNNVRVPTRFVLMLQLLLPLIALAALQIVLRVRGRAWRIGIPAAVLLVCGVEYRTTAQQMYAKSEVPKIYHQLAKVDSEVLLPIPFGLRDGMTHLGAHHAEEPVLQTIHRKTVMGGYISRIPEATFDYYQSDTACVRLMRLFEDSTLSYPPPTELERKAFFSHFSPDCFLIQPEWRGSHAEAYLFDLIAYRRLSRIEEDGYLLLIFAD